MSHSFAFRPGTNDEAMFRHLVNHNEYGLPDEIGPEEIIVDVGVHIGGFSYSALGRGARRVFGFEAEPSNYECAVQNLAPFGERVQLENKAVWRSDRPAGRLHFSYSTDRANTGGGGVLWNGDGPAIETVPFDEVIERVTEGGRRRISLLKIDCEGSEFPILLTARRLDRIDRIAGEFHEINTPQNPAPIPESARVPGVERFSIEALADALRRSGFEVTWKRHGETSLGLFDARRTALPRPRRASLGGRIKTLWHHLNSTSRPPQPAAPAAERTPR